MRIIPCLLFGLFTSFNLAAATPDWADTLSNFQTHRVYPYVEKAYRLEQQQDFRAASKQLEYALGIVPNHLPLLRKLAELQLKSAYLAEAATTIALLPDTEQQVFWESWVYRLAEIVSVQEQEEVRKLYDSAPAGLQQKIATNFAKHYISVNKPELAADWLALLAEPELDLLLYRARYAVTQSQLPNADADYLRLLAQHNIPDYRSEYCLVLASFAETEKATEFALASQPEPELAACYRQLLQLQLAQGGWQIALEFASALQQVDKLAQSEARQLTIAAWNLRDIVQLQYYSALGEVDCLDQTELLLQLNETKLAAAQFRRCHPTTDQQRWLVYAEKMATTPELVNARLSSIAAQRERDRVVRARELLAGRVSTVLERLFQQPLHRDDYDLAVNLLDQLNEPEQQVLYLERLYQQFPKAEVLNRLSVAYMKSDRQDAALNVLVNSLPWHNDWLNSQELAERLLNLLAQNPKAEVLTLLSNWPHYQAQRAELWRLVGQCDQARSLLSPEPDSVAGWRTLALCESQRNPAYAIQYWQYLYQKQADSEYQIQISYLQEAQGDFAAALETLVSINDSNLPVEQRLRLAELARQNQQLDLAVKALEALSVPDELAAQKWSTLARAYQQQQRTTDARQAWELALQAEPNARQVRAELAYAIAETDPLRAIALFEQLIATATNKVESNMQTQLAYLYYRTGNAAQAAPQALLATQWADDPVRQTEHLAVQRLAQQLNSPWRFSLGASFVENGFSNPELLNTGVAQKYSSVLRTDYFLDPLHQNFSGYLMLSSGGDTALTDQQGAQLGLSYKPFEQQNIWLAAAMEKVPLSSGDWRAMLRLSADLFNQTPWQADWRPEQRSWYERRLYTDFVLWPKSGNNQLVVRWDQGVVYALSDTQADAVKAYWLTQFDYRKLKNDATFDDGHLTTAGLGLSWRRWLGQALHQRLEVSLEWRYQLDGVTLPAQHAWYLQFSAVW